MKHFLMLSFAMISPTYAYALGAEVVTDPGSYVYYAEQIEQAVETIKKLDDQITEVKKVQDGISETTDQLRGNYAQAIKCLKSIKSTREELISMPTTIEKMRDKWKDKAEEASESMTDSDFVATKLFKDARSPNKTKKQSDQAVEYHIRQTALKDAIIRSDTILKNMPSHFDIIEELANEIDNAENMKAAADLTNRILIEILTVLQQQLVLSAQFAEAESFLNYKGVDEKTTDERMKQVEDWNVSLASYEKILKNAKANGVDPFEKDDRQIGKALAW